MGSGNSKLPQESLPEVEASTLQNRKLRKDQPSGGWPRGGAEVICPHTNYFCPKNGRPLTDLNLPKGDDSPEEWPSGGGGWLEWSAANYPNESIK